MLQSLGRGHVPHHPSGVGHTAVHQTAHTVQDGITGAATEAMVRIEDLPTRTSVTPQGRQALAQAQTEVQELMVNSVRQQVQATRTARPQQQRTGSQSSTSSATTVQNPQDLQAIDYELMRNTIADASQGIASLLSIAGDRTAARQLMVVSNAGLHIMDGCRAIAASASIATAASTAAATSTAATASTALMATPIAPYVCIAMAVASLLSLMDDDDNSDGLGQALNALSQQIQQVYEALSAQIRTMHEHMLERFDGLERNVNRMHVDLVRGFLRVSQQMRDGFASNQYSFEQINSELQQLHAISVQIDGLLVAPMVESCSAIQLFSNRFGSLRSMQEREAIAHCQTIENALLGVHPTHECVNGYVCADVCPATAIRMLASSSPASLLGYLARYATTVLGQPVPQTIRPEKLAHLGLFELGLRQYLKLRKNTPQIAYDTQCHMLNSIAEVGHHALTFIHSVQTNRALFERLCANYQASYQRTQELSNQAFEKRSSDLLDLVHSNAVLGTSKELNSFPILSKFFTYNGQIPLFTPLYSRLCTQYEQIKPGHQSHAAWISQNKFHFKTPITSSPSGLLSNPDKTLFAVNITPNHVLPDQIPLPLNLGLKPEDIKRWIPMQAIIAERLGIGAINVQLQLELYRQWADRTLYIF